MPRVSLTSAIAKIDKAGLLLVFPIKEKPDLPSLWKAFYPKEVMQWDWSEDADNKVASLWHLRSELSTSNEVVYSKWFKNRATFFSLELFTGLLSLVSNLDHTELSLSRDAEEILTNLEEDSPLPSKELKQRADLAGRENSTRFERAMRELWQRYLIVGYGEVEEGGYPSLAVGSAKLLFEDAWDQSKLLTQAERVMLAEKYLKKTAEFYSQFIKVEKMTALRAMTLNLATEQLER